MRCPSPTLTVVAPKRTHLGDPTNMRAHGLLCRSIRPVLSLTTATLFILSLRPLMCKKRQHTDRSDRTRASNVRLCKLCGSIPRCCWQKLATQTLSFGSCCESIRIIWLPASLDSILVGVRSTRETDLQCRCRFHPLLPALPKVHSAFVFCILLLL